MSENLAWYPWYPWSWRSDEAVEALSPEARGMYRELLDRQWINKGSIPSDLPGIARAANCSIAYAKKHWPAVAPFFVHHSEGRLHNVRLTAIYAESIEHAGRRSERSRRAAEVRWTQSGSIAQAYGEHASSMPPACETDALTVPNHTVPNQDGANAPSAEKPPRPARQVPLADADEIRARAILELLWPQFEVAVFGAFTKTRWKAVNKAVALDLARVGATDDDLLLAHRMGTKKLGPLRTLAKLQEFLAEGLQLRRELEHEELRAGERHDVLGIASGT
jgi:uncharacterized protein YdaU (DUF1376 family)